jgi:hypothetical protein
LLTPTQFIALWQYVHNYLVTTEGLTNLVWNYGVSATGTGTDDTLDYPGAPYTDVTSFEVFSNTPGQSATGDYAALLGLGLPVGMQVFGAGSSSAGNASFTETTLVSQVQTYTPNVVWFMQQWSYNATGGAGWGMDTLTNTANLTTALSNPFVINRGGIVYNSPAITWNPGDTSANVTLSGGNLTATQTSSSAGGSRDTVAYSTGSYCFETTVVTNEASWAVGLSNSGFSLTGTPALGGTATGYAFYTGGSNPQSIYLNGVNLLAGIGAASANGDKVTTCVNLTTDLVWVTDTVMRNAGYTWNNSTTANPATATGGVSISGLSCPCYITANSVNSGSVWTLNVIGPFAVSTPSGFTAWQPATVSTHHPFFIFLGDNDIRYGPWYSSIQTGG